MTNPIFEQLKTIVLPSLERYQEDLTKHDFNTLQNYKGKFLYSWRSTGTNFLKLENDFKSYFNDKVLSTHKESELKEIYKKEIVWITHEMNNKGFLYFDGAILKRVTREQAKQLHASHIDNIIYLYEQSKKQNLINF
jgi:predicted SprT family Zn-dependent metalloprotease